MVESVIPDFEAKLKLAGQQDKAEIIKSAKILIERFSVVLEEYAKEIDRDISINEIGAAVNWFLKIHKERMGALGQNYFQLRDLINELGLEVKDPYEEPNIPVQNKEKGIILE